MNKKIFIDAERRIRFTLRYTVLVIILTSFLGGVGGCSTNHYTRDTQPTLRLVGQGGLQVVRGSMNRWTTPITTFYFSVSNPTIKRRVFLLKCIGDREEYHKRIVVKPRSDELVRMMILTPNESIKLTCSLYRDKYSVENQ